MKDFKYIIKRVIIGVLIAIILFLLKSNVLYALSITDLELSPTQTWSNYGQQTYSSSNTQNQGGVGFNLTYTNSISPGNYEFLVIEHLNLFTWGSLGLIQQANVGSTGVYTQAGDKIGVIRSNIWIVSDGDKRYNCDYYDYYSICPLIGNATTVRVLIQAQFYNLQMGVQGNTTTTPIQGSMSLSNTFWYANARNSDIQQQIANNSNEIKNAINSDDVSSNNNQINDMQNSINSNDTTGLSGIITAPLRLINNLTQTCSGISINLPFINTNTTLPCMSTSVYNNFPELTNILAVVINGFLIYRVIASLYYMVKGFKDPDNDKVEVLDL